MEEFIEVDGQKLTKEQFEEMKKDAEKGLFRLKEIAPNQFRKLEKLIG